MLNRIPHLAALRLRCPKCGRGKLFHGWFHMNSQCDSCGLSFEREAGFFLGSIYVNYGVTALTTVFAYLILVMTFELPAKAVVLGCVAFTTLFPLWFFRYARSVFMTIDYRVSPGSYKQASDDTETVIERSRSAASTGSRETPLSIAAATAVSAESPPIISVGGHPDLSAEELTMLHAEDAHAGAIIGIVVLLAVVFGVTMGSFFVFTTMR